MMKSLDWRILSTLLVKRTASLVLPPLRFLFLNFNARDQYVCSGLRILITHSLIQQIFVENQLKSQVLGIRQEKRLCSHALPLPVQDKLMNTNN